MSSSFSNDSIVRRKKKAHSKEKGKKLIAKNKKGGRKKVKGRKERKSS